MMNTQTNSVIARYKRLPEISLGKCPHCGKKMLKHIIEDGARYHVISYCQVHAVGSGRHETFSHCSEPDCEINHGPGCCVPLTETPNE